jgi:hypothetical protein
MIEENNFNQPPAAREPGEKKKTTVICSWCKKVIGEKDEEMASGSGIDHGICDECKIKVKKGTWKPEES